MSKRGLRGARTGKGGLHEPGLAWSGECEGGLKRKPSGSEQLHLSRTGTSTARRGVAGLAQGPGLGAPPGRPTPGGSGDGMRGWAGLVGWGAMHSHRTPRGAPACGFALNCCSSCAPDSTARTKGGRQDCVLLAERGLKGEPPWVALRVCCVEAQPPIGDVAGTTCASRTETGGCPVHRHLLHHPKHAQRERSGQHRRDAGFLGPLVLTKHPPKEPDFPALFWSSCLAMLFFKARQAPRAHCALASSGGQRCQCPRLSFQRIDV